jgi:hypothetical protein
MQYLRLGLASALIVLVVGCESGTGSGPGISGPPPAYEDISGQYSAPVNATSTGLVLTGTMYLFLTQEDSAFRGSYALVGTLEEGAASEPITLIGAVSNGALALGSNPLLTMEWRPIGCGATFVQNSGSFSGSLETITMPDATIPVQDLDCAELLRLVVGTLEFTK